VRAPRPTPSTQVRIGIGAMQLVMFILFPSIYDLSPFSGPMRAICARSTPFTIPVIPPTTRCLGCSSIRSARYSQPTMVYIYSEIFYISTRPSVAVASQIRNVSPGETIARSMMGRTSVSICLVDITMLAVCSPLALALL